MCGVIGILGRSAVNQSIYDGLTVVQHRGQDAAGIITSDNEKVYLRKDNGLVRDVFHTRHMRHLLGNMGIGHCRYPTAGSSSPAEAQPFYVNSPFGVALAHNGNLTNAGELRESLFREDLRHLNTSSDSEILLNVLAHELYGVLGSRPARLTPGQIFAAVEGVFRRCRGAFAVAAMIVGHGILAFRDRYGIRPLVYGQRETAHGIEHMFASESVALDVSGFTLVADVQPGEAIFINLQGQVYRHTCVSDPRHVPCIFEHVYLARPDSIIDGIAVHKTRLRMGEKLARKILRDWPDHDIDVILSLGIDLRLNMDVGRHIAMHKLHTNFDAVLDTANASSRSEEPDRKTWSDWLWSTQEMDDNVEISLAMANGHFAAQDIHDALMANMWKQA